MDLHKTIKRLSRRHWEATAARLHADVRWEDANPQVHDNEYSDMHEAVSALYEGEEPMIIPKYKEMSTPQIVESILARLSETEAAFGTVRDDQPIFIDAGLCRALRNAMAMAPLDTSHPLLKMADQLHTHLTQCVCS